VIILTTKQKIHHEDGDRCAGDDHKTIADKKEPKHIVDFAEPDAVHHEVKLNKDSTKREDTDDKHAGYWTEVVGGGRNLTRDLIRADRCLDSLSCISGEAS